MHLELNSTALQANSVAPTVEVVKHAHLIVRNENVELEMRGSVANNREFRRRRWKMMGADGWQVVVQVVVLWALVGLWMSSKGLCAWCGVV